MVMVMLGDDLNHGARDCHCIKELTLNRDEEDAEEGRAKVLAARQREREETRAQVGRDWK